MSSCSKVYLFKESYIKSSYVELAGIIDCIWIKFSLIILDWLEELIVMFSTQ